MSTPNSLPVPDNGTDGKSTGTEELAKLHVITLLEEYPHWLNRSLPGPRGYRQLFQLVKKHPFLAKQGFGAFKNLPLVYLLAARAPLEMIQEVYEMNQDALKTPDRAGDLPIWDCLANQCSPDVVEFVLRQYPKAAAKQFNDGKLPISFFLQDSLNVSNFNGDTFAKVFQLLYQAYSPGQWDDDIAWGCNLGILLTSPNTPPSLMAWLAQKESDHTASCRAKVLERYHLDKRILIRNLKQFVPLLKCSSLALIGHGHHLDADFLGQLFSEVKIPPALGIELQQFRLVFPASSGDLAKTWGGCHLERLALSDLIMSAEDFACLLKSLHYLSIKKLLLGVHLMPETIPSSGCTEILVDFLEETPTLCRLDLVWSTRMGINSQKLQQALQTSKSTAFICSRQTYIGVDPGVAYSSAMNHHGRTKIKSPKASLEQLVDCLASLEGCPTQPQHLRESVLYGLLLEAPGLWATAKEEPGFCKNEKKRLSSESMQERSKKKMK